MMSKKILVISSYPAPYRVAVFQGLLEYYDLDVFFEFIQDQSRSADWFVRESRFHVLCDQKARQMFRECLRRLRSYDLVLAYDYNNQNAMKVMSLCMAQKVPYCINCDGAFIHSHWLKDRVKSWFISHAAACFASGDFAGRYFIHYGAPAERVHFHRFTSLNESDISQEITSAEEKRRLRQELGLPEYTMALTIGQFILRKGFDVLLEAWKGFEEKCQLVLIGGGEKEREYREKIDELGLHNVYLKGFMKKEEIFRYYHASDLFVLPTREDIWGLVINEAMACGLPVISTDHCIAAMELVEEGVNGRIVPAGQAGELRRAMQQLLAQVSLRETMGRNNLKKMKDCTISAIVRSHKEVIDTL